MKEEMKEEGCLHMIDELIVDFLSGNLEEKNKSILEEWRNQSLENEIYFKRKSEIWMLSLAGNPKANSVNKEKAYLHFQKRIQNQSPHLERNYKLRFVRYAAAIIALCLISVLSYKKGESDVKENLMDVVVETPIGSRVKLSLPDGSLLWLNSGSRIIYSQRFGIDNRMLSLCGEGYFEVERNESLPFLVRSDDMLISVLGTKFNMRDYEEDKEAIVTLLAGNVRMDNLITNEEGLILSPNERIILDKTSGEVSLKQVDAPKTVEWTKGYLFFEEELLPDITRELERNYNVSIRIDTDSLTNVRFYGNFIHRDQSILEVMDALSTTGKINYKIEGQNITIY